MKLRAASLALGLPLAMALYASGSFGPVGTSGVALAAEANQAIVYNPSGRGSKGTRIAGQSRGGQDTPALFALTPNDTGETALAQPTLYWYVSKPIDAKIELTIIDERTQKTVLETQLDGPVQPGVWSFPLGVHRVSLVPDVEYRWSVSLVRDPQQRSLDLFASGTIVRVSMPQPLASTLNKSGTGDLPFYLARAGLWYDALAVLSVQIAHNPADRRLRAARASLLEQVGLPEAAAYDKAS